MKRKKVIRHPVVTSFGYTAYNTKTKKYHVGTDTRDKQLKPIWSRYLPDPSFLGTLEEALEMFPKNKWPEIVAKKITTKTVRTTTIETVQR